MWNFNQYITAELEEEGETKVTNMHGLFSENRETRNMNKIAKNITS